MAEKIYIVTLEDDTTHKVIMSKIVSTRIDAEIYARDFQRFEKDGKSVYIRMEKF